jgi:hypothetical protein
MNNIPTPKESPNHRATNFRSFPEVCKLLIEAAFVTTVRVTVAGALEVGVELVGETVHVVLEGHPEMVKFIAELKAPVGDTMSVPVVVAPAFMVALFVAPKLKGEVGSNECERKHRGIRVGTIGSLYGDLSGAGDTRIRSDCKRT